MCEVEVRHARAGQWDERGSADSEGTRAVSWVAVGLPGARTPFGGGASLDRPERGRSAARRLPGAARPAGSTIGTPGTTGVTTRCQLRGRDGEKGPRAFFGSCSAVRGGAVGGC